MADQKLTCGEKNWILYDVANSAFILLRASLRNRQPESGEP